MNTKKLAIALITSVGLSAAGLTSVALAHGGHMRGEFFDKIDANKDGKVTLAEAKTAEKDRFTAIDANKDGKLTAAELEAHHQAKRGDRPGKPEHAGKHKERGAHFFAKVDANNDGAIDAAESAAKAEQMFARMDDNSDGVVTKDELGKGRGGDCGHKRGGDEGAAGSGPKE